MQWTEDQWKAISAKDGTLLVSAAAGSGKTAVLVERVLSRLEDAENGCDADALLIVTFTKAATAQMREKIAAALAKRIAEAPDNLHLLRQQALLPFAHISTIDSFCADIVRENFQKLGIEPDYKIAEEHPMLLMRREAAAEVAEQFYAEEDADFGELCELLFRGRDDGKLIDTILELDTVASSYPDPEKWLGSLYDTYTNADSPDTCIWGQLARQAGVRVVETCLATTENALQIVRHDKDVAAKYVPFLCEDQAAFEALREAILVLPWDEAREKVLAAADALPPRCPVVRGNASFEKDAAQETHKKNKERLQKQLEPLFCTSAAEFAQDAAYCLPLLRKLSETVLRFREALMQKKKESNSYAFSDISLFALQCLTDENGEKNDYAASLSRQFREILIDEFQDVNEAQYRLFSLLSRDGENLFMVGDAKQSIYKFRQARPDIFIGLKEKYPLYTDGNYPATVLLGCNFRSRAGVTEWVNFTFRQLMYRETDSPFEVNYDARETLHAAAVYPPSGSPDAELHLLRGNRGADSIEEEARYIAQYMQTQLQSGLTVSDGDTVRSATFRDFCILLRADNGRIARLAKVLTDCGIPAQAGAQGGFFEAPEIEFALSLLQVLDNPLQDVPLLSVMLSPVFGFSPDDLAALRVTDRSASLYALLTAAAKTDARIADFLLRLSDLRMLSATLSAGELVRRMLDETGYLAVVGAMTGGAGRRANLLQLARLAAQYEQSGRIGLPGFVRFLERLREQNGKVEKAGTPIAADAVQIMTIHRSKGLEFPVCILANCAGDFNAEEYRQNYIYHNRYGMATVRRDTAHFAQYDTVPKRVLNVKVREANINEELRILYVAMTRAKEKLVALARLENPEKKLAELSLRTQPDGSISGVSEMTNYAQMLLCAALRHPDAHILRETAGVRLQTQDTAFPLYVTVAEVPQAAQPELPVQQSRPADAAVLANIRERTAYRYPFAALSAATAKHTASEMETQGVNRNFFASSAPAFLGAGGLTPAQRGTVLHRFMQYADYKNAAQALDKEIERLQADGIFNEQEADVLPRDAVQRFFASDTGKRILCAETVLREKRFTIEVGVRTVYPDLPELFESETVIIQGMVDCAFVEDGKLYIVDYKTDREPPAVLRERYRAQLRTYRTAMEQCTDYPVAGTLLYSFHNHCTVEMDGESV